MFLCQCQTVLLTDGQLEVQKLLVAAVGLRQPKIILKAYALRRTSIQIQIQTESTLQVKFVLAEGFKAAKQNRVCCLECSWSQIGDKGCEPDEHSDDEEGGEDAERREDDGDDAPDAHQFQMLHRELLARRLVEVGQRAVRTLETRELIRQDLQENSQHDEDSGAEKLSQTQFFLPSFLTGKVDLISFVLCFFQAIANNVSVLC